MITLHFIGIGMGNPDHLTAEAIGALNNADVILLPRKGPDRTDLADLRRQICDLVLKNPVEIVEFDLPIRDSKASSYLDGVQVWHSAIATTWQRIIFKSLPEGGRAALMIWGDPALYDSSLRIADRLLSQGMPVQIEMVPGLTSFQILTAAHRIPLNT
ncbi:MAG: SAM-dependent methyltransferase, partial [Rhodobacterales bacterium]